MHEILMWKGKSVTILVGDDEGATDGLKVVGLEEADEDVVGADIVGGVIAGMNASLC